MPDSRYKKIILACGHRYYGSKGEEFEISVGKLRRVSCMRGCGQQDIRSFEGEAMEPEDGWEEL